MRSSVSHFFGGLWLFPRALRLIVSRQKLLLLSLLSALVAAAVLVSCTLALWPLSQTLAERAIAQQSTLARFFSGGLRLVIFALGWILSALTLPSLFLAPLQDPLSEATEAAVSTLTPTAFSFSRFVRGIALSLSHTLTRLLLMFVGSAILFPLHFIPAVGSALWWTLSTGWAAFWLAAEHVSGPSARHFLPFRVVLRVLRARMAMSLGFGLAAFVVLWVPVLNFFLMPLAVVAGTLLFVRLRDEGLLDDANHPTS
jgi:CysZ protein